MATELNTQISPLEMQKLQTSIKYHDLFLGFVVVVGVSLSIYLVDSMNALKENMADVRTRIEVMQQHIDILDKKVDRLDKKMDRYHGGDSR